MPKSHLRPEQDFTVTSFAWDLQIEDAHQKAGFPEISREVLARRFWQFLRFLRKHKLTFSALAESLEDISEHTVLRNSDLTDHGFYFIQKYHGRWLGRSYKDRGEEKEDAFLEKWYQTFQSESASAAYRPYPIGSGTAGISRRT